MSTYLHKKRDLCDAAAFDITIILLHFLFPMKKKENIIMFFRKNQLALLFSFVSVVVRGDWHQDVFYQEINRFRHSPVAYQQNHTDVVVRCTSPLDESYHPLSVVEALQNSSSFQAWTLSTNACTDISHDTCPLYCDQFDSCSYMDRIDRFLQGMEHHNTLEILIKGPKNPYKIFHYFLESQPHCDHMLNCHINSMGARFSRVDKNVFVADFAYIS